MIDFKLQKSTLTAAALATALLAAPAWAQTATPTQGNPDTQAGPNGASPAMSGPAPGTNAMAPNHNQATHPQTATTHPARHVETVDERIKSLHDRLRITQDQEGLWNDLAQVMRQNAQAMEPLLQQRAQNAKTMSAPDDLKSYEEITETHAEGLKRLTPAFDNLYTAMSDAQKKNADAVFRGLVQKRIPSTTAKPAPAPKQGS